MRMDTGLSECLDMEETYLSQARADQVKILEENDMGTLRKDTTDFQQSHDVPLNPDA